MYVTLNLGLAVRDLRIGLDTERSSILDSMVRKWLWREKL